MRYKIKSFVYLLCMMCMMGLCGCSQNTGNESKIPTQVNTENLQDSQMEEVEKTEQKIRLMMLGDNLLHPSVMKTGYKTDGSRNYDHLFEPIKEYLDYADIKMINQETVFGGNDRGFTGFPYFNSPTEVGDAIVNAGFNVVLHASNHTADQGIDGLLHCVEYWETYPEVLVTGIFGNEEKENEDIGLLEIEGVTFAILNYTYGPNAETISSSIQGHLGMLCDWDENTGRIDFTTIHPDVLKDIAQAEEMADVVIVCPHWGTEYVTTPSTYQQTFAKQMTEAGADLIIGTHPHVVQPVEWIESENGNRALCYYSLGNYVSGQDNPLSMLEAMAWVTFLVDENGVSIVEEETGVVPLVCHYSYGPSNQQVYLFENYTSELAKTHGVSQFGTSLTYDNLVNWTEEILGEWVLDSKNIFPK